MELIISELALQIATEAHQGQEDKAGVDYIEHPKTVASFVSTDEEKATAYLHDVLEDTAITAEELLNKGIPENVVKAVELLTKKKGQPYFEYLEDVKSNSISRIVKLADLRHNSDLSRLKKITETDYKRIEKYKKAIDFLSI
ncbi:HD domain-containing protein [Pilibacter termitis]|uniref:HD domain-containing protein n=1 Tax=Pilibacter termitis TaxID=263852 RepID=A0A1T4PRS6_9ENTE|nr:HD domain-containing protein [Pilibacter termitis]SJZ93618.1 HD domain-containing protein [Pilibacter termitis]